MNFFIFAAVSLFQSQTIESCQHTILYHYNDTSESEQKPVDELMQFWHHSSYISKHGAFPPEQPYIPPLLPDFDISIEDTNVNKTRPERDNFTNDAESSLKQAGYYDEYPQLESLAVKGLNKYQVCKDEEYWTDYKHGDGKASCMDMSANWCNNFGDYSIEARRACPVACGLCSAGNVANQDHLQGKDWDDEIKSNQFTKPTALTTEINKDTEHAPKPHQNHKDQLNLPPVVEDSASSSPPDTSEKEKPKVKFVEIEKKPQIIYAKELCRDKAEFCELRPRCDILHVREQCPKYCGVCSEPCIDKEDYCQFHPHCEIPKVQKTCPKHCNMCKDDDTNMMNGTSVTSEHLLQDEDKRNRHIAQTMTSPNYGSEYQKDLRYFET